MQTTLLRHADFRRLWAADALSQVGTQVTAIALPLLLIKVLDAGPFEVGLLTTFEFLAFLVVGLPAGVWVDRMRRRNVLMVADLARALLYGSLPLAWALDALPSASCTRSRSWPACARCSSTWRTSRTCRTWSGGTTWSRATPSCRAPQSVAQVAGPTVGGAAGPGADRAVRGARRRASLPLVGGVGRLDPVPRGRGPSGRRTGTSAGR